jgi:stage II sporulation protein B
VKSSGYAASTVEQDGSFFVFMGIGADQQSIAGIKAEYENTEFEYFEKAFVNEGGSFTNAAKPDSDAITASLPLFKGLLAQSSQAFGSGTIADAEWEKLSAEYAKVKEIKQEKLTEDMKGFITQLISSYESLQTFKTGGDKKVLWQSQQAALDAFSSYTKWVSKLS